MIKTMNPFILYNHHKMEIDAYLKGDIYEGFTGSEATGISIGAMIAIIVVCLVIWIWALVITIMYWNNLPTWAKVIGILGLVTGIGPVVTIIVVYIGNSIGPDKKVGNFKFY